MAGKKASAANLTHIKLSEYVELNDGTKAVQILPYGTEIITPNFWFRDIKDNAAEDYDMRELFNAGQWSIAMTGGGTAVSIPSSSEFLVYFCLQLIDHDSPTVPVNSVKMYSSGGEAKVVDASGNVTTFSPHNTEGVTVDPDDTYPTTVHHQNAYLGTEEWIYLSKMARLVEQLTGEQLVFSREIPRRDWNADQISHEQTRQAEIIAYDQTRAEIDLLPDEQREKALFALGERPQPYVKQPEPDWIKQRKDKQQR